MRSGDRPGHRTKVSVKFAFVFKALFQDLHLDLRAFVGFGND